MIAYLVPAELIFGSIGFVIAIALHNTIAIIRVREQIARIDEWIRQQERRNGQKENQ